MSTALTGTQIQNTYTQVLQVNAGVVSAGGKVADGLGHDSTLVLGTTSLGIGNWPTVGPNDMSVWDVRTAITGFSLENKFTDLSSVGTVANLVSEALLSPSSLTPSAAYVHYAGWFKTDTSAATYPFIAGDYAIFSHNGTGLITTVVVKLSQIEINSTGGVTTNT